MARLIINAENQIMGRLASKVAKLALEGNEVIVLNSEKVIISGKKLNVEEKFKEKHERGDPYHGPFYPRYPDQILKRVIRGMIPYKKSKGREAFKRIKCYIGVPEEFKEDFTKALRFEELDLNNLNKRSKYVYLEDISKKLGANWE